MLETYRGIPHLLDTWLVLTGMAVPIAIWAVRRPGHLVPRLASLVLPTTLALILTATLSPGVGLAATVQLVLRPVGRPRTPDEPHVHRGAQRGTGGSQVSRQASSGRVGTRDGEELEPPPTDGESPMRGSEWFSTGCG